MGYFTEPESVGQKRTGRFSFVTAITLTPESPMEDLGQDISGTLQGAGGIGGLMAVTRRSQISVTNVIIVSNVQTIETVSVTGTLTYVCDGLYTNDGTGDGITTSNNYIRAANPSDKIWWVGPATGWVLPGVGGWQYYWNSPTLVNASWSFSEGPQYGNPSTTLASPTIVTNVSTNLVSSFVGVTELYYPCYDANGNITEYLDTNGTIAAHYEFDPYGNVTVATGDKAGEFTFRFSTKQWDDETGLGYWGYRYYSAALGRWVSRDPAEESGGLNLNGFVGNSPITERDALGEKILSMAVNHSGKAQISDADYVNMTVNYDSYYDQILPGNLGFREKLIPKHSVWVPHPWGAIGMIEEKKPARRAVGFKFEYVIESECTGTAAEYGGEFKLTQWVVDGSWYKRKKGSKGTWKKHDDVVPSFPHEDGPTLVKFYPALPKMTVVGGDMVRHLVEERDKWEYWLKVTWRVRAEDKDNAFEGKHRITMFYDGSGGKGGGSIVEPPKEVK